MSGMNERLELADVLWEYRLREHLGQDRILEEAGFKSEALTARGGLSIEANWGCGWGWGAEGAWKGCRACCQGLVLTALTSLDGSALLPLVLPPGSSPLPSQVHHPFLFLLSPSQLMCSTLFLHSG